MGDVYLARLEALGSVRRLIAVKFLRDVRERDVASLLREARLMAMLSHPNIVHVIDAGVDNGRPWFAMEFVAGLSMADLLEVAGQRLPPWVAARIVADLALGVHALHEARDERGNRLDIVHRDLSPHNVLVSWEGVVKLLDLGIARSQLQGATTQSGIVRGKLGYMSPEQASGQAVDQRSDVFVLGVLLWEALAGRRCFQASPDGELLARVIRADAPSLSATAADAPAALCEVAHRALHARPADRFASSLEMQRALEVAMRASDVMVGAYEVGQALAELTPDRVNEHEGWLRDANPSAGGKPLIAPRVSSLTLSITPDPRAGTATSSWGSRAVAVLLGAAGLATLGIVVSRRIPPRDGPKGDSSQAASAPPAPPLTASQIGPPPLASNPGSVQVGAPQAAATDIAKTALAQRTVTPPTPVSPTSIVAGVGTVSVVASPNWATIFLDGKIVGQTPLELRGVAAGLHTIEARALGTERQQRRVVGVVPGAVSRVEFSHE
jgi:eukaryotic-like serine/threonine-protein kinase